MLILIFICEKGFWAPLKENRTQYRHLLCFCERVLATFFLRFEVVNVPMKGSYETYLLKAYLVAMLVSTTAYIIAIASVIFLLSEYRNIDYRDHSLRKTMGLSIIGLKNPHLYRTIDYRNQEKTIDTQLW